MWALQDRATILRLKTVNLKIFVIFTWNIKTPHKKEAPENKTVWREEEGKGEGAHANEREILCRKDGSISLGTSYNPQAFLDMPIDHVSIFLVLG